MKQTASGSSCLLSPPPAGESGGPWGAGSQAVLSREAAGSLSVFETEFSMLSNCSLVISEHLLHPATASSETVVGPILANSHLLSCSQGEGILPSKIKRSDLH